MSTPRRWVVVGGVVGGGAVATLYALLVLQQRSSTAALGFVFLPVVFGVATGLGAVWAWSLYQIVHTRRVAHGGRGIVAWLAALVVLVGGTGYIAREAWSIGMYFRIRNPGADATALEAQYRQALAAKDYLRLAAVAEHRNTPPAILLELARSDDPGLHDKRQGFRNMFDRDQLAVERKVLRNPNAPAAVIPLLAKSSNEYVLADVAWSRRTPEAILRDLARHDHHLIRWALAGNPATPRDILEALAKNDDVNVAKHLGRNGRLPAALLAELSRHADSWVRQAVADNPSIDGEIASRLAADVDEHVRFFVAANRGTPRVVLERLAADPVSRVASRARVELERGR